ncbi:MAG: DJ-1/PfpI family protein [Clostridiales bacterium]|nr:DJ-1/PfpI family protein [Clostridiales bacterium]
MRTILCFVPEKCADFEAVLALHLLNDKKDRQIMTVGYSHEPVRAQSGLMYTAELTLEEAAERKNIEAFIMPGGELREPNERLNAFIQALHKHGVLLAAICYAPQYLAHTGLLDSHRYTTSCTPEDVQKLGVPDPFPRGNYADERVVTDGNVITAQGHAFVDFAFAIARHLGDCAGQEEEYDEFYMEIMNK